MAGETLVGCPTCSGSGEKTIQLLDVAYDTDGNSAGRTVTKQVPCPDCDGMGVIPGGPPVV